MKTFRLNPLFLHMSIVQIILTSCINLYLCCEKNLLFQIKKKKTNDILCRSKLMKILYFVLCRLMHIWNVFSRGCCFTLIIFSFFIRREISFIFAWKHWISSKFPNAMWYCIYSGIAQFFPNSFWNNYRLLFIIYFYFKTVLNNVLRC